MKIIFSRKGFDWANGGMPSPVMPDGTMLSFPIPSYDDDRFSRLEYNGETYQSLIEQLKSKNKINTTCCHLDPDIRRGIRKEPAKWVPIFGQADAALTHLDNQNVGPGDLFMFFGWFRKTEIKDGKLKYISKEKDVHMMYGYLQVGQIARGDNCCKYSWHPHSYVGELNAMYVASDKLVIDGMDTGLPGAGVFKYSPEVVLTKPGETRSRWLLPEFFKEVNISYHSKDCFKNGYFQTVRIGQEFVVSEDERVTEWAKNIILNNYDKY